MARRGHVLVLLVLVTAHDVEAGGWFLPLHGVRPAGRGGAFVAGADDVHSLFYNPAGLAEMAGGEVRNEVLLDLAVLDHAVTYTRIDSGGNTLSPVENDAQVVPIPTVGAVVDLGQDVALGLGIAGVYGALDGYPDAGGQRYSLVTLHDSVMAVGELAFGWRITDSLRVGAGFQNLFLAYHGQVVVSGCPAEIACAPEDPEFDALTEFQQNDLWNPSGILGATWDVEGRLRVGAALQLPFSIASEGTVRVRLPSSDVYDGATVAGDQASMTMTLPASLHVGVEVSPSRAIRLEAGVSWEMWSQHDEIRLSPDNVRIEGVPTVGTYELGPMSIPRHFEDTWAIRVGIEGEPSRRLPMQLRAGYVLETSAVPDEYLSVMTVDADKQVVTAGASYGFGKVRLDAVVGRAFLSDRNVASGTSCVPQLNPIRSGQEASDAACVHDGDPDHVYVGDGTYLSSWTFFGLGAAVEF